MLSRLKREFPELANNPRGIHLLAAGVLMLQANKGANGKATVQKPVTPPPKIPGKMKSTPPVNKGDDYEELLERGKTDREARAMIIQRKLDKWKRG